MASLMIEWVCDTCGAMVEVPVDYEAGDCCGFPMRETASYSEDCDDN